MLQLIINGISTGWISPRSNLVEKITGFNDVQGFSGIVTGITTIYWNGIKSRNTNSEY